MANENTVLAHLRHWLDDSAADSELLPLCLSGLDSIRARLRDKADDNDLRAISAAAAIALYQYQLKQRISGGTPLNFKAGDMSIQSAGDPLDAAIQLRDYCLNDATVLFNNSDFVFLTCG